MAAITKITRHDGVYAVTRAYTATDALRLTSFQALPIHVCYAQLTGNMTINFTDGGLQQFQEVYLHFSSDASIRVVTFGTLFLSSGTLSTVASKDATVKCIWDGTNLKVISREICA